MNNFRILPEAISKELYAPCTILGLNEEKQRIKHPKLPIVGYVAYVPKYFFDMIANKMAGFISYYPIRPIARISPCGKDFSEEFLNFILDKKENLYGNVVGIPNKILEENDIQNETPAELKISPF